MEQELSDISITVGQKLFHAHKLLLCISSDVFKVWNYKHIMRWL